MKYCLKIFALLVISLFPIQVLASVIINEIAWMGTNISYSDEWIELYNNTNSLINLDGWTLKAIDGTPEINISGIIQANGFFVLERTDDTTLPNIIANQIYTGALGNKGEHLKLFDNQNNLIDEVNCTGSWFAGDNKTKQTMERTNSGNWQTSQEFNGTPGIKNSVKEELPIQSEPESQPELKPKSEEKIIPINYPTGIIFNEILPSPEGPDSENE